MTVHTRKRWLTPDSYVEVRYQSNQFPDGSGQLDVYLFEIDPRKAQHHKPKFWSRNSSHCFINPAVGISPNQLFAGNGHYRKVIVAAREVLKELRLTSSVSRAAA